MLDVVNKRAQAEVRSFRENVAGEVGIVSDALGGIESRGGGLKMRRGWRRRSAP